MLRHKLFTDKKIQVSKKVCEDEYIHLDEEGYVEEDLTDEAEERLLTIPDFERVDYQQVQDQDQVQEVQDQVSDQTDVRADKQDQEQVPASAEAEQVQDQVQVQEKVEDQPSQDAPEPKENDTKIENGKGYIYKPNKAGALQWLRHKELDESL